jgi:hypothetical protein
VQQAGTSCTLSAIHPDLSTSPLRIFAIFSNHDHIEPGETIHDVLCWKVSPLEKPIIWVRIDVRTVSGKIEWNTVALIRVDNSRPIATDLDIEHGENLCDFV